MGAIEPAFFAALLAGLELDAAGIDQSDRAAWPILASRFAARFAERSRDDWATVFAGTDACVTPVLSLAEAPHHPHNHARATFAAPSGPMQPMPAPRFSATPAVTANRQHRQRCDLESVGEVTIRNFGRCLVCFR